MIKLGIVYSCVNQSPLLPGLYAVLNSVNLNTLLHRFVAHEKGDRPPSLKGRRPIMSNVEMFLWRNYLIFLSCTAPPSTSLQASLMSSGDRWVRGGGGVAPLHHHYIILYLLKIVLCWREVGGTSWSSMLDISSTRLSLSFVLMVRSGRWPSQHWEWSIPMPLGKLPHSCDHHATLIIGSCDLTL